VTRLRALPPPPQYKVPEWPPVTVLHGAAGRHSAYLVLSGPAVRIIGEEATFEDLARTLAMGMGGRLPTEMWAEPTEP
jgi:hypothetical protein